MRANWIIIKEADVQKHAVADTEVIDLIWCVPTHYSTVGKLPQGATVLQTDPNGKWVIFKTAAGEKKIQFDVTNAENVAPRPLPPPSPAKKPTPRTEATVGADGKVYVTEGMHRLQAAQNGVSIPPDQGGVPGLPGWLEYNLR